ncbi:hypothetical protein NSU_4645 [Novosphingobium pentaromativorans US6-1]|uniref:Uncharacterized protein n=1 Tax=Novosphingobium pentaromativorans US6-1 TaxID=1088721 RepID=G6EJX4_9SPHN|nr:hypothetical protein NSU_4645 [Novosphingobium pentaromativorans US6-1]
MNVRRGDEVARAGIWRACHRRSLGAALPRSAGWAEIIGTVRERRMAPVSPS